MGKLRRPWQAPQPQPQPHVPTAGEYARIADLMDDCAEALTAAAVTVPHIHTIIRGATGTRAF